MFEPGHMVFVLLATAGAAFVQGYAGFGFGITTMALLAVLPVGLERLAALATLLAVANMVAFLTLSRSRTPVRWDEVWRLAIGIALGLPLGYWFVWMLGEQPIARLALGLMLLAFAAQGVAGAGVGLRFPRKLAVPMGAAGGFFSGAFATGGPPQVLYLYSRVEDPRQMKATVKASFLLASLYRLLVLSLAEPGLTPALGWAALACLPGVLAMLFLGHALSMRAQVATFRRAVYGLIGLMGLVTALRAALVMARTLGG